MGTGLFSPWHIAIFVLVVCLVFGPKMLPEIGRSLGKGVRELKDIRELKPGIHQDEASAPEIAPKQRSLPMNTRDRDDI